MNQRFPVFYSEKRPFFMEGAGIFAIAGADSRQQPAGGRPHAAHHRSGRRRQADRQRRTRHLRHAHRDRMRRRASHCRSRDANAGRDRLVNVARAQYSLGPSNYTGALVTDTRVCRQPQPRGRHRPVVATVQTRSASRHSSLGSRSVASNDGSSGAPVRRERRLSYSTRVVAVERLGSSTTAPTSRWTRRSSTASASRSGWIYGERNFYPDKDQLRRGCSGSRRSRSRRAAPTAAAGGHDLLEVAGARFNFTRQGFLRVDRSWGFETWAGATISTRALSAPGATSRLFRWLKLEGRQRLWPRRLLRSDRSVRGDSHTFRDRLHAATERPPARRRCPTTTSAFDRTAPASGCTASTSSTARPSTNSPGSSSSAPSPSTTARGPECSPTSCCRTSSNPGTVAYIGYGSLSSGATSGRGLASRPGRLPRPATRPAAEGVIPAALLTPALLPGRAFGI